MPLFRRFRARNSTLVLLTAALFLASCGGSEPDPIPTPAPSASPAAGEIAIFLHSGDPNDCAAVTAVSRAIDGEPTLEKVMAALMAGPTETEKNAGLGGWFDEKTRDMLISAEVVDGVAQVDFKDLREVIPNASSSCGSAQLLSQLDNTAEQLPEVTSTLYSINGDTTAFYEWLQMVVPDA